MHENEFRRLLRRDRRYGSLRLAARRLWLSELVPALGMASLVMLTIAAMIVALHR